MRLLPWLSLFREGLLLSNPATAKYARVYEDVLDDISKLMELPNFSTFCLGDKTQLFFCSIANISRLKVAFFVQIV